MRSTHALEADELMERRDLSADEARYAAGAFGNVTTAQERFYESFRWAWLDRTVRHALRRSDAAQSSGVFARRHLRRSASGSA
jgi:hypothetical protein